MPSPQSFTLNTSANGTAEVMEALLARLKSPRPAHSWPSGGKALIFVPDLGRFHRGQCLRTLALGDDYVRLGASRHDPVRQVIDDKVILLARRVRPRRGPAPGPRPGTDRSAKMCQKLPVELVTGSAWLPTLQPSLVAALSAGDN